MGFWVMRHLFLVYPITGPLDWQMIPPPGQRVLVVALWRKLPLLLFAPPNSQRRILILLALLDGSKQLGNATFAKAPQPMPNQPLLNPSKHCLSAPVVLPWKQGQQWTCILLSKEIQRRKDLHFIDHLMICSTTSVSSKLEELLSRTVKLHR